MNVSEYNMLVKDLANMLEQVMTFDVVSRAKHHYHNSLNYRSHVKSFYDRSDSNHSLRDFESRFHFGADYYSAIIGMFANVDGKRIRYLSDVLDIVKSTSKHLHFYGKTDNTRKSGKTFSHTSFVLLDDGFIDEAFSNKMWGDAKSAVYTKQACKSILNDLLQYKKGRYMTKAQKEQYNKEYAEGKHLLTLEDYIKDEAKKKRQADKHRMTIAKKAARQTMKEYASMAMELEKAKAEIERLKSCKDVNSDIHEDVDKPAGKTHLYEYDELGEAFPDGIEPEDIEKCSEACKKRLDEEAAKDFNMHCCASTKYLNVADDYFKKQIEGAESLARRLEKTDCTDVCIPVDDIPPDYTKELVDMLDKCTKAHCLSANSAKTYAIACGATRAAFKDPADGFCQAEANTVPALKRKIDLYTFMIQHFKYELERSGQFIKVMTSLNAAKFAMKKKAA